MDTILSKSLMAKFHRQNPLENILVIAILEYYIQMVMQWVCRYIQMSYTVRKDF